MHSERVEYGMTGTRIDQQFELKDGRRLGYAEYGAPEGVPVLYMHGFPGSRLDYLLVNAGDDAAVGANARIIAGDRPGMGLSDVKRRRKLLDWPDDVTELADALQFDRFSVLGYSGGGPYAAACAFKIPGRLSATGIACGMCPPDAPGMVDGVSWTLPGKASLMRQLLLMMTSMGLQREPERFLSQSKETFSGPDRQPLDRPEVAQLFMYTVKEALRPGSGGANQDAGLYARPWGFRLEETTADVNLWHGGRDEDVPLSVSRYAADALPNCKARFYEGEGHLTLPHNRMKVILSALVF
jgi:pimeloyl-ACP methyl ester carboxylesterase